MYLNTELTPPPSSFLPPFSLHSLLPIGRPAMPGQARRRARALQRVASAREQVYCNPSIDMNTYSNRMIPLLQMISSRSVGKLHDTPRAVVDDDFWGEITARSSLQPILHPQIKYINLCKGQTKRCICACSYQIGGERASALPVEIQLASNCNSIPFSVRVEDYDYVMATSLCILFQASPSCSFSSPSSSLS